METPRRLSTRLSWRRSHLMQFLLILLCTTVLGAQTLALSPQNWDQQITPPAGIPLSQAAQFSETGKEISIGPWIAGLSTARLVYKGPIPLREGSIHGRFRTENLYPREAIVWITYRRGTERISELSYWLGVTDHWESFTFPHYQTTCGLRCDFGVVWIRHKDSRASPSH